MDERNQRAAQAGERMGHGSPPGTIWLVGMMGAGKTVVGRALSLRLARKLVDTDASVEQVAGVTIPEIFERDGEVAFRRLERAAIEAVAGEPVVASVGGGAMAQPGVAEQMSATGPVVYLRARIATLLRRVGAGRGRPLLANLDPAAREARLRELLAKRGACYEQADIIVDTDELDAERTARHIEAALKVRISAALKVRTSAKEEGRS